MRRLRSTLLVAAVAFLCAAAGVLAGRALLPPRVAPATELQDLLRDGLALDAGQRAQIDALEKEFALRRRVLEAELRAQNVRLADAIDAEHADGPRVAAAVDASHRSMGELQKATLAHVFAMRRVLRPDQTDAFDRAVAKALTDDPR